MAGDNHNGSRIDITGRFLAMCVGKPSHSYHPNGCYTATRSPDPRSWVGWGAEGVVEATNIAGCGEGLLRSWGGGGAEGAEDATSLGEGDGLRFWIWIRRPILRLLGCLGWSTMASPMTLHIG